MIGSRAAFIALTLFSVAGCGASTGLGDGGGSGAGADAEITCGPDAGMRATVCTACGPAGGCASRETRCARPCTASSECTSPLGCENGFCQVALCR